MWDQARKTLSPHEAWHVVQQKQGRVKPTLQAKRALINDDAGLEQEADVMGAKALRTQHLDSGALKQPTRLSGVWHIIQTQGRRGHQNRL